jgi:hypothetical protein
MRAKIHRALALQGWWKLDHATPGVAFGGVRQVSHSLSSHAIAAVPCITDRRNATSAPSNLRQFSNKAEVNIGRKTRSVAEQLKKLKKQEEEGDSIADSTDDSAKVKADVNSSGVRHTVS